MQDWQPLFYTWFMSHSHIMENAKFLGLLMIKQKPLKELMESCFEPQAPQRCVLLFDWGYFGGNAWEGFIFVCFAFYAKVEYRKNRKLIKKFISARKFHARCLINITIILKEKKYWPSPPPPPPFPQTLSQRCTVIHFRKLPSFVGREVMA